MPASPAPRDKAQIENLWNEYDAYAKFDNAIIFVISDLFAFEEYLKTHSSPLPSTLVHQFVQDFQEFMQDAIDLKKRYQFSKGEECAKEIVAHVDSLSNKSLGKMLLSHDYTHLERALEIWALSDTPSWRERLSSLGRTVIAKMTSLEQELASAT
ncbi:MAG: hypothetical protein ACHQT8_04045 [Chlamydiales bacterium]